MGNPLRDRRTAAEWAALGQVIEIAEEISSFDGLQAVIAADLAALDAARMPSGWHDFAVRGELRFGYANEVALIPTVVGRVTATVPAVCQRCMELFSLTLVSEPRLLLLTHEESVEGCEEFEVWELDDQQLQPDEVIEELLIMALPFAAMHDNLADCKAFTSTDENVEDMKRPFAELRTQMKQNEQNPNY